MIMNNLEPSSLFNFFFEICRISRESGNESGMTRYLEQFAKERKLEYQTDKTGNVVIRKAASAGKENSPCVILQSHTDMVCEKTADTVFDFSKEAIQCYVEDGWLRARGTTLGADDGIGVAASLAVLDDDSLEHGPLECLFTVSEETGLDGARAVKPGFIKGTILLNLDSEDEGEVFIGCAGGIDTTACFTYLSRTVPRRGVTALEVRITGGTGGHSGDEIHKDLCNAVQLLARFLWKAQQDMNIDISSLSGGNKRNAIAREAGAVCVVRKKDEAAFRKLFQELAREWEKEYKHTDPELQNQIVPCPLPETVIDKKTAYRLISALYSCPHGVLGMSKEVPGLVETSTNLASVKMEPGHVIRVGSSQRSAINSARRNAASRIESIFLLAGAQVTHQGEYPGWAPNPDSPILKVCVQAYKTLFNTPIKVKAIHAGLECGIFLDAFPYLDMISFGPTLKGVHSPAERLDIESTGKFWKLLLQILKMV
ncbi:MAG TPA: aminoacyl-histidine dipeptidase [Bacteroidales bacterium]|nr:aminoacyl-histidine dipeptidase [Bacteroidales bacterium]